MRRERAWSAASRRAVESRDLRGERRELLRSELEALGAILTPEQREKVKDYVEDRMEARTAATTDSRHCRCHALHRASGRHVADEQRPAGDRAAMV